MSSTPPIDRIEIEVGDFPLDSSFIEHQGTYTLFLRPQTFGSAVQHVRNVLPHITLEAAESMVREQCPEFPDFDKLMGLDLPPVPSIERPAAPPVNEGHLEPERHKRRRRAVLVAALLPALVASWAVGRYTNVADTSPDKQAAASTPDASPDAADADKAPFTEPRFTHFAGASSIDCDPISPLEAECTDADGKVMSTKAATGPDSTVFTFSYGSERIGLRIFYDADYAKTWARQEGTQDLYPNLEMHGRYALWGTDPVRIKDYGALIAESARSGATPMGGADPLPPRLAALTLGTLGLDQGAVHQLMAQSPTPVPSDTPAILAARLVLGLDQVAPTPAGTGMPEGDDIVAIAAGIEPRPSTGGKTDLEPSTEPSKPVTSVPTGDPGTEPASPTPQPPPTNTTPPAEASTDKQEQTAPPAETKPPATKPPTTPATETPPAQPSTPPAEPTAPAEPPITGPGEPAEETPAPPAEEPSTPPGEELPAPPAEETPAPADPPAEETAASVGPIPGQDDSGDDLLVLDSAWTVGV
ncbi:hypothetical protein [Streptomyces ardesiacus]|uniref:hypothetical protein n=1 Tax=Streptomyces ardesiacus TaxID=285564 RepID=UPI000D596989|nr:hypothetical protein [Streptomyces ardesiacus]